MVKKRVKSRKPTRKSKSAPSRASSSRGDRSRLDLKPLQTHIRRRIKDLESGVTPATGMRAAESTDDTIARLKNALDTLADICFPTMDVPI